MVDPSAEVSPIGLLRDSLQCEWDPDEIEVREGTDMERSERPAAAWGPALISSSADRGR